MEVMGQAFSRHC